MQLINNLLINVNLLISNRLEVDKVSQSLEHQLFINNQKLYKQISTYPQT